MIRVGVLANPRAGGSRWLGRALPRLASIGPVAVTGRLGDLPAALSGLRRAGTELLAVVGGDGTLHAVLRALQEVWSDPPPLFPIPGGTAGLVHHNLGLGDTAACLVELEAIARGERAVEEISLPTVRVGHSTAFNVGIALPQRLAALALGRAWTATLTARLVASAAVDGRFASELLAPWRGSISVDGGPETPLSASILYASALARLGPLRGWSRVQPSWDGFRLLHVPEQPPSALLARFPAFALGLDVEAMVTARRVRLSAQRPFVYTADGEPYVAEEIEVQRGPAVVVARARAQTRAASTRLRQRPSSAPSASHPAPAGSPPCDATRQVQP